MRSPMQLVPSTTKSAVHTRRRAERAAETDIEGRGVRRRLEEGGTGAGSAENALCLEAEPASVPGSASRLRKAGSTGRGAGEAGEEGVERPLDLGSGQAGADRVLA